MSSVRSLYTTLAAVTITYTNEAGNAVNVTGRDLSAIKDMVDNLQTPTRIILPLEERGAEGSDLKLLTVGTTNVFGTMMWSIADLYLHAPTGTKLGLSSHLPDLVRYAGAYAEKIADAGADLGIGVMTFAGLSLRATIIEWPVQSGQHFYGVEAQISYEELINP